MEGGGGLGGLRGFEEGRSQHIGLRRIREKGTADGVTERWRECICGK